MGRKNILVIKMETTIEAAKIKDFFKGGCCKQFHAKQIWKLSKFLNCTIEVFEKEKIVIE